jgi:DNA-binding LacI/PurR family transcriptional regulator
VVGFGDHVAAAVYTPGLTTVRVPSQQAGERAAQLIVRRIEHGPAHLKDRFSSLNAVFIVGETTGIAFSRARNCAG